jgi:hypothetical protein
MLEAWKKSQKTQWLITHVSTSFVVTSFCIARALWISLIACQSDLPILKTDSQKRYSPL